MGGKRGRKRKVYDKKNSEDWCFSCKDGGSLRVCDYKDCRKSYHPQCVEKDESFLNSEDHWSCEWHLCFICKKAAKFRCFCCPLAVCGNCNWDGAFVNVSPKNHGFCQECLTLTGRIEGIVDPEAKEEKLDFGDQNMNGSLFRFYWEVIRRKEGLTSEHILAAKESLQHGINDISGDIFYELELTSESDEEFVSDFEESEDAREVKKRRPRGRKKKLEQSNRRNARSSQLMFNGWGSSALFNFLAAIGKDTTQKLLPHDVGKIIFRYCMENNLFDPQKKKKVICDERLQLLLGRKSITKNSMLKLLSLHFAENLEESEIEFDDISENEDEKTGKKRLANPCMGKQPDKEEVTPTRQGSCFAAIVAENIKTVYLRRSVVEKLSKEPETFAAKILGAFVRVKSDPNDYSQNNPYQLLQVASIMSTSDPGQTNPRIFLQANFVPKDIPICELSDDDFCEEELEDLRRRMKSGLSSGLTVVNLEEKAWILHDVITGHYIKTELIRLQNRVDWASEKRRKLELAEYMDKLTLLLTRKEQERLLNEVPKIIPEEENVVLCLHSLPKEDRLGSNAMPDPTAREKSRLPWKEQQCNPEEVNLQTICAVPCGPAPESQYIAVTHQTQCQPEIAISIEDHGAQVGGELGKTSETPVLQPQERYDPLSPGEWTLAPPSTGGQSDAVIPEIQTQPYTAVSTENQGAKVGVELGNRNETIVQERELIFFRPEEQSQDNTPGSTNGNGEQPVIDLQRAPNPELIIILSDDEEEAETPVIMDRRPEMVNSPIWYCESSQGTQRGPYSLTVLKEWSEKGAKVQKFKVWKSGQGSKDARPLGDVLRMVFSVN